MPRPLKTDRPISQRIWLPETLYSKLQFYLFSPVEGKVPHGAVSRFYEERVREFFDRLETQAKQTKE